MTVLRRLTTEYVEIEDRIRIAGQTPKDAQVVMWLTNRLATRAVPQLLRWLENQAAPTSASSRASAPSQAVRRELQSFAQATAVAGLKQQKPVTARADDPAWVAKAIDIKASQSHLSITFRGAQDQSAGVRFDAMGLRQWLSILHRAWTKAQWPPLVWPDWIKTHRSAPQNAVRH
ncbi:hypothetical protein BH10PSE6_BH10PSE6_47260 [soil metagenome]